MLSIQGLFLSAAVALLPCLNTLADVTNQSLFLDDGIILSDIGSLVKESNRLCAPGKVGKNLWQVYTYETMDGLKGSFVYATTLSNPGELTIELPVSGWHRIFIGQASRSPGGLLMSLGIDLKLDGDTAFTSLAGTGINWFWEMTDNFYRAANLQPGMKLHIRRNEQQQASLAWIRLEPMSQEEIDSVQRRLAKTNRYFNIVTNDAYWPNDMEQFEGEFAVFADSNVKKLYFLLASGDVTSFYDTSTGNTVTFEDIDYEREIDRDIAIKIAEIQRKYPDAVNELAAAAHKYNLEFHASVRTGAWYYPSGTGNSQFFLNNPQWQCRLKDGTPVTRMSFAAPEVQDHMLALFREILSFDVDGLNLIFIRALPNILYEEPFLNRFKAEYNGLDPRELADDDERVIALRCKIMTEFMEKTREVVDQASKEKGRKLELSLIVPATEKVNYFHGLALKEWADAKLIDLISVDGSIQTRSHQENVSNIDLSFFEAISQNSGLPFFVKLPGIWDNSCNLEYYQNAIAHGATGVMLWDGAHNFALYPYGWEWIHLLGSGKNGSEEAESWLQKRPHGSKVHLIKKLDGYDYDQYPPHVAY